MHDPGALRSRGEPDALYRSIDAVISLSTTGRSAALAVLRLLAEEPRHRI